MFLGSGVSRRAAGLMPPRLAVAAGTVCVVAGVLATSGCSGPAAEASLVAASSAAGSGPVAGIRPLTSTSIARDGHFSDPYPVITRSAGSGSGAPTLFGTFPEVLSCPGHLRAGCYKPTGLTMSYSPALSADFRRAGLTVKSSRGHHPFLMPNGTWQMAVTIGVTQAKAGGASWNLILHAHPVGKAEVNGIPTDWVGDSVLVGSLAHGTPADYDGKYYRANGRLYLIYQKLLSSSPARFGIVAQAMTTPRQPASSAPVTLLEPYSGTASINSENYISLHQAGGLKLVETGNIIQIAGKYVMVYATGSYRRPTYKIGLAYSGTFLPRRGAAYRKITMRDPSGVWGKPGADEVRYLLQSQEPRWPDYAGATVQAPGVGTIVRTGGSWYLIFAGYDTAEKTSGSTGIFDASHRRPYFVPLNIRVPRGVSVSAATPQQLATWITLRP